MSKRARAEETARKAGLRAFETSEGRSWLWKALNPQNIETTAIGIPSYQTNNISCLNYQSQYDITPPTNVSASTPAYDVDLFLNHNPLLFGSAITSPTGTMDFSEIGSIRVHINTPAGSPTSTITLVPEDATIKTVALRTTTQLINSQINPEVFRYSGSLASRRVLYSQLTQKARMVYGSALAIPTCSDMNNGGLITACQQICEPRKTTLNMNGQTITLNCYEKSDFPNISDTIQNPQMYSARYNDGCYMPYKMREPFTAGYTNSEVEVTCKSPYVVTNISAIYVRDVRTVAQEGGVAAHDVFDTIEKFFTIDNTSSTFRASVTVDNVTLQNGSSANTAYLLAIKVYVTNLLGQRGFYYLSLNDQSVDNGAAVNPAMGPTGRFSPYILNGALHQIQVTNVCRGSVFEGTWDKGARGFATGLELTNALIGENYLIKIPDIVVFANVQGETSLPDVNGIGLQYVSLDVSAGGSNGLDRGTIPDMLENQMATVHMTGVSSTAPIKLILKMGVEILLTAGSPYSPFKFISPKYDESALKSYLRCTRIMRDAFYANAGGSGGQAEFVRALNDLIENDTAMPITRVMNQGGNFVSVIG